MLTPALSGSAGYALVAASTDAATIVETPRITFDRLCLKFMFPPSRLLELISLRGRDLRRERQVVAFARHVVLPLPAQHVTQELAHLGIERCAIAGGRIGCDVD